MSILVEPTGGISSVANDWPDWHNVSGLCVYMFLTYFFLTYFCVFYAFFPIWQFHLNIFSQILLPTAIIERIPSFEVTFNWCHLMFKWKPPRLNYFKWTLKYSPGFGAAILLMAWYENGAWKFWIIYIHHKKIWISFRFCVKSRG